jgi:CobQ-like glutamine amidotransferase family enzyme
VLLPEILGTYGDGGNAAALGYRLSARGLSVELVPVGADQVVPLSCDLYLLGGSEDGPQEFVAGWLASGDLARAAAGGAGVVAVCSGLQLLGREFPGPDDRPRPGLGLLPCTTLAPAPGLPRAVGDVVVRGTPWQSVGDVIGFENHRGRTVLDPGATPLGSCVRGHGNDRSAGPGHRVDGVVHGRIVGTYLHGPVLALTPLLADVVLSWVLDPLPPVDDPAFDAQVASARRRRLVTRHAWRVRRPA